MEWQCEELGLMGWWMLLALAGIFAVACSIATWGRKGGKDVEKLNRLEAQNSRLRLRVQHVEAKLRKARQARRQAEGDGQRDANTTTRAELQRVAQPQTATHQSSRIAKAETAVRAAVPEKPDVGFTRQRLERISQRGAVLLTFVNSIRLDFAHTWVTHVRRLGLTNFLVGAADSGALQGLLQARTPCFDMHTDLPTHEWPWGSGSFKALGPHKIEMIHLSITWGLSVLITDIDALVLRDPFPYMARWPDAAFLTTTDHLGNTTSDDGLETHNGIHSAFNIGYMLFRPSAAPLVLEWRRVIREKPTERWDQGEFNRLARVGWKPGRSDGMSDSRLFWSYEQKLIGGVLPIALFAGGHNYFVSQLAQRRGEMPYSVHTTFQYSGAPGKRHRLREAMFWEDPAEYYEPKEGLLTYIPDVPERLLHPPGGMRTTGHIELINFQLRQIRSALALAHALGRILVLPRVVCGYDKAWYALSGGNSRGAFGGAHAFVLPIRNCPLDHYLEVATLNPATTVREYSLFSNPRTPARVLSSVSTLALAPDANVESVKKLKRESEAVKARARPRRRSRSRLRD